jgi:hypothetical protein
MGRCTEKCIQWTAMTQHGRAQKVVARYVSGHIVKGTTANFSPERPTFLLHVVDGDAPVPVKVSDLKALFFVRSLAGDASYSESKEFSTPVFGGKIAVTFQDGERLVGASLTYSRSKDGFFLFPADPRSNNERVYVVMRAVASVDRL